VEHETGDAKQEAFEALMRKLVVHETAEQEIVHPLLKDAGDDATREQRLTEEKSAERMLEELEGMGTADPGFASRFEELKTDVLTHAEMEEAEEHPEIRSSIDAERLRRLAPAFRAAEKAAPTRPHPMSPTSPAGNLAVGPIVGIMDRARDAVRDAMRKMSA
jgi:hemerythrin superfamily protein